MIRAWILFIVLSQFTCLLAQEEVFTPILPKSYLTYKTSDVISFDGKQTENSWLRAEWTDDFIDIIGRETPHFGTHAKILWDDEFIYIYAELEEKHIWGDIEERDQVIFYNNDFEVFLKPYRSAGHYAELEVNALGTVWDLLLMNAYREGGPIINDWNMEDLRVGVHYVGTLNKAKDLDKNWSVEIGIPWSSLDELLYGKVHKTVPEPWQMNFSRVQWDHDINKGKYSLKMEDDKLLPEHNWVWSQQSAVDMHRPEHWGTLYFSDAEPGSEFIPVDSLEPARQYLFELYRRQKKYFLEKLMEDGKGVYASHLKSIDAPCFKYGYCMDSVWIHPSEFGYEISMNYLNTKLTINEQGRLIEKELDSFTCSVWMHGDKSKSDEDWKDIFRKGKSVGISDFFIGADAGELKRYVALSKDIEINIHAWVWTLNRPGDSIAMQHPEWYAVNRAGKNSLEYNAYVGYYQWLSPFSEGAREHIKNQIRQIAEIDDIASVHLDYVRFCDVILGRALQPKYELVQDHEMEEYDYGYHPDAIKGFKEIFGYDPRELEFPELSTEWRQYRLNAVSDLVNELAKLAHEQGKNISAAVFPFPLMSRSMVRQDWPSWNLDLVLPMIYHNFYEENLNWIKFATEQGVRELNNRFPLYSGLYLPALTPNELIEAIDLAQKGGANGVSLFDWGSLTEEHFNVLKERFGH